MTRPSWLRRAISGLTLAVAFAACDTEAPAACPGAAECPDPGPNPGTPTVVAGVDLAALFADPSPREVQSARGAASGRPPSVTSVETVATIERRDRETVRVVAGRTLSGTTAFAAAVRQPPRRPGDQRARPLLLVLSEGPNVDLDRALDVPPVEDRLDGEFVTVAMAYRGQRLTVGDQTFASDVPAEPYVRDADDVLALAAHVRASTGLDRSDASRLVVVGWGRGGTVALLAAARGLAPQMVISLGAPTDFLLLSVRDDARRVLTDRAPSRLPQVASVLAASAEAVRDGQATVAQARQQLLLRSPAHLTRSPPFTIAAHGGNDGVAPVAHLRALVEATGTANVLPIEVEEAGHDTIGSSRQVVSTVTSQVCQRLLASEPVCSG